MKGTWLGIGLGLALGLAVAGPPAQARSKPKHHVAKHEPRRHETKHDRSADERAIADGERAWGQAYVTGDVAAVRRLLDDSFHGVDPRGSLYDKAEVIRDVQADPHETSDTVGPVTVRIYGDAAVAQAREHEVGPAPEHKAVERMFTDTWVRRDGRWRIVAAEDLDPGLAEPASTDGAYAEDRRAILALRDANNRALAAHDLDGAMNIAADDYVVTGGDGGIDRSVAENRKAWAAEFARSGYGRYVRTPVDVEVGEHKGVLRAAESGTWQGLDQRSAGEAQTFGRYFVHWSKATGRWRVVSESYVTLGCRGPGC
jgi:ketosteroid isomerase-like protein